MRCLTALLLILLLAPMPLFASETDDSLASSLVREALELHLERDPYWHVLLHYRRTVSGYRSYVDDPRFFLATDGATSPTAELEATLRAIAVAGSNSNGSPFCRFIGRYHWLDEKLGLFARLENPPTCDEFDTFLEALKPTSMTLVFPAAHINHPASMFGHTMLTVNSAADSRLLSYAITYAAADTEKAGRWVAIKGLFGALPGLFSVIPYYDKLREYSDIDQREVWEYRLNLDETEIRRLLLHFWELRDIRSDYFYLDENCAFGLLFLLDAARPSLRLQQQFPRWVTPIATIKAMDRSGLIESVAYRPSPVARIERLASELTQKQLRLTTTVLRHEADLSDIVVSAYSVDEQVRILDTIIESAQVKSAGKPEDHDRDRALFLDASRARSKLGLPRTESETIAMPPRPDRGHDPASITVGIGYRDDNRFVSIGLRPVYHDLMDSPSGYQRGSRLELVRVETELDGDDASLEGLTLMDVLSLTPRRAIFKPISWSMKAAISRPEIDGVDHRIANLQGGRGGTWTMGQSGLVYALLETDLQIGGALEDSFAAGLGVAGGLVAQIGSAWNAHIEGRARRYGGGHDHDLVEFSVDNGFRLCQWSAFLIRFNRRYEFGRYESVTHGGWRIYF